MEKLNISSQSPALSQIMNVMTVIAEAGRNFFSNDMTIKEFETKQAEYMRLVRESHAKLPKTI